MRRQDGSVNFTRDWEDYKVGFGSLTGEFWAGNVLRFIYYIFRNLHRVGVNMLHITASIFEWTKRLGLLVHDEVLWVFHATRIIVKFYLRICPSISNFKFVLNYSPRGEALHYKPFASPHCGSWPRQELSFPSIFIIL